jgi:hypothetical protein
MSLARTARSHLAPVAIGPNGRLTKSVGTQPSRRKRCELTLHPGRRDARPAAGHVPLGRPRRLPREEVAPLRHLHAGASAAHILSLHRRWGTPSTKGIYLLAVTEVDLVAATATLGSMMRYLSFLFFASGGSFAARIAVYGFMIQRALNLHDPLELVPARAFLPVFAPAFKAVAASLSCAPAFPISLAIFERTNYLKPCWLSI